MIEDNAEIEQGNVLNLCECSNEYWKKRYRIKKDHVPTFLQQYQQKILRTGKYLNTIKQCSEFLILNWFVILFFFFIIYKMILDKYF